jgi:hypothetical protein
MLTQSVEIVEDLVDKPSSEVGAYDIRSVLKNSQALDLNEHINSLLDENRLSMFRTMTTKHHGRLITVTEMDKFATLVGNGAVNFFSQVFSELFDNPKTNPIICNNPGEKECRFKIGDEWKTQTLTKFLCKDHECNWCRTVNRDFIPTCRSCMECVRTIKPEYAHISGYEIDDLIDIGVSPYKREYKVTNKTFKENGLKFNCCCLRGMISNFSKLALMAYCNTMMLYKCGEIKLSTSTTTNVETCVKITEFPDNILDPKERPLFKAIYTVLCNVCTK